MRNQSSFTILLLLLVLPLSAASAQDLGTDRSVSEYLPRSVSLDSGAMLTLALTPALALGGRVVAEDGGALGGVDLEARPEARRIGPESEPGSGPPTVSAQSDEEGRFLLQNVAPGTLYRLVASRPGYSRAIFRVAPVELGEIPEELVITLAPGVVGFGSVLDLDERPIAGAQVRLHPDTNGEARWQRPRPDDTREAATDDTGRFELRDLPPGTYSLTASAPGYSELLVPGVEVVAAEILDLGTVLLDRGRRLAGRVGDPDGGPVAGARVSWQRTATAARTRPAGDDRLVVTDSDGTFTLDGLPAGALLELEVRREGFQSRRLRDVRSGQERLDVVLKPGVTLRGQVVDAAGQPASGVTVELARSSSGRSLVTSTSTDTEGRFELDGLAPGKATASVRSALGFSPPQELALRTSESPLTVRWELQAGATVSGWILDPEGAGVAGGTVGVRRHRPGILEPRLGSKFDERRADEEGRFTVSGLAEGHYRLTARHPDFVAITAVLDVGDEELYPLDLEFSERRSQEGLRLTGRVVAGGRQGVHGAGVTLIPSFAGDLVETTSRGDGRFEVRATTPGEHFIEVRHPDFAAVRSPVVDLGHGPVEELLVELEEGGSIVGSIHGLDPGQLPRLKIVAFSRGLSQQGQVAYDGSYRLAGLAAGEWTVQALADRRRASGTATLQAPGEQVLLDLGFEPGFRLEGYARMDGDPLSSARVEASCPDPGYHATVSTDGEGRFELRDVPQGDCTLTLAAVTRSAFARRQVAVRGDTEVEIEVAATAVTGEVLHLHGLRPIAGATVELLPKGDTVDPRSRVKALTDSQGRFALPAPDRGMLTVRVAKEGFAFSERQIDLDARPELRLLLAPEEVAVLYVIGPEGDVPALVEVEVRSFAGGSVLQSRSYQPQLDGKVTLRSLPTGFWQLYVTGQGFLGKAEVEVPGEPVVILLGAAG